MQEEGTLSVSCPRPCSNRVMTSAAAFRTSSAGSPFSKLLMHSRTCKASSAPASQSKKGAAVVVNGATLNSQERHFQ